MQTWSDQHGNEWIVPQIKGRLKFKIPAHKALRDFVIHRAGNQCEQCGAKENLVADHKVSIANGGSHSPENLQCLCQPCNSRKSVLIDRRVRK